jgi:N-acetylmuramoyl-L-alanine amidase
MTLRTLLVSWFAMIVCVASGCASREPVASTQAATQPVDPVFTNIDQAWALLANRPAWTAHPVMNLARHPAEKHLAGLVIVLDPGHGASDGKTDPKYKRGPTGVMEDHMNLRTALLLQKLLVDAGATVLMTRETDTLVTHQERADVANHHVRADGSTGADLFISVHHNYSDNPKSNYTSIWYHGEVDWNGMELDVGRYVAHALGRHLRTDVARTSPLLSDQLMYKSGFAMLRLTKVPAILCEISFYSNPEEEQRLADATYNLRSAYAIYEGLCEWAYCGRPTVGIKSWKFADVVTRSSEKVGESRTFFVELNDGLPAWWGKERNRIDTSSIAVFIDGRRVEFNFDAATRMLAFDEIVDTNPPEVIDIRFRNMLGNSNVPARFVLADDGTVRPALPTRATGDVQAPVTRPATQPATAPAVR